MSKIEKVLNGFEKRIKELELTIEQKMRYNSNHVKESERLDELKTLVKFVKVIKSSSESE